MFVGGRGEGRARREIVDPDDFRIQAIRERLGRGLRRSGRRRREDESERGRRFPKAEACDFHKELQGVRGSRRGEAEGNKTPNERRSTAKSRAKTAEFNANNEPPPTSKNGDDAALN